MSEEKKEKQEKEVASENLSSSQDEGEKKAPEEPSTGEKKDLEIQISSVQLEELQKKAELADKNLYLAQKTQADLENYRKRVQKEKELDRNLTVKKIMNDLLPIVDNLERALSAVQTTSKIEDMVVGLKIIQSEVEKFFKQQDMKVIDSVGKPFDPQFHQALVLQETSDHAPGTVIHEIEKGYLLEEFVIRHAKVIVAKEKAVVPEQEKSKPSPENPA